MIGKHIPPALAMVVLVALLGVAWNAANGQPSPSPAFNPPKLEEIPAGPEGEAIRLGYEIVMNTPQHVKGYVGNALSCRNCHLDAGRIPHAGPFVGVYAGMPEYRTRNAKMNTIEIRINDCFERSLNGKALPYDSREMGALVSFMAWMSKGVPAGTKLPERGFAPVKGNNPGNLANGKNLYAAECASCHGAEGQGTFVAPPLWGPQSYNKGAGMTRVGIAASFIRRNMPLGQAGTLTDDEAYDLAAFINSQPRPEFPARLQDWSQGGKPVDILY